MAPKIDEYDVFRIPHSRMMQLVNSCNKNLNVTDFANNDALFALLSNLHSVFNEFKSHEDIENEHIMKKLKSKLNAMAIYNSAVCNCHKDDEFTPLLNLVETGYLFTNKTKTTSERISYGVRLRKALNKFTKIFVPHMKEEEEIFQPLLVKYFSLGELVEMKNIVIKLHIQRRKSCSPLNKLSSYNKIHGIEMEHPHVIKHQNLAIDNYSRSINNLPSEVLLKIFSNLSLKDKLRAAKVNKKWHLLIYDKSFWREININDWKPKNPENFESKTIRCKDEDDEDENQSEILISEVKILQFWIKQLLPRVGSYLTNLNLSNCKSLNNNMTRKILQLCPNLSVLDLSYTKVGDNSFKGIRLDKMSYLNFEGCEKLSDNTFKNLLISSIKPLKSINDLRDSQHSFEDQQDGNSKKIENCETSNKSYQSSLNFINLSGCWAITDFGLSYIASKYDLNNLEYLNLSGCLNLTSLGLRLFVETSDSLTGENFYYCDNIVDGPMRYSANGCENLECLKKFCCRYAH